MQKDAERRFTPVCRDGPPLVNGETLYSQVEKTLEGGTTFVQLREKELDEAHFLEEAKKLRNSATDIMCHL